MCADRRNQEHILGKKDHEKDREKETRILIIVEEAPVVRNSLESTAEKSSYQGTVIDLRILHAKKSVVQRVLRGQT